VVFNEENREHQQIKRKTMNTNNNDTAVVVIDPQNDALSEKGVSWERNLARQSGINVEAI
jgi:hypothetical protein